MSRCEYHRDLVIRMANEGAYLNEISRAIGTGGRHIRKFLKKNGIDRDFPTGLPGERCPAWKRGWTKDKDGYKAILLPGHPHARKHTGYVLEHRLVMEKMVGRYLLPEEVVHHKNGVRDDNRPENLQLFSENSEHLIHELTGKVPKWTAEGLARIKAHRPRKKQSHYDNLKKLKSGG